MSQRRVFQLLAIMTMAMALILIATTGIVSAANRGAPGSSAPGNPPTKAAANKKSAAGIRPAISGAGYNNEGISADGATPTANFDGIGFNYSNNALTAAGFASVSTPTVNGVTYQWPTVAAGASDNWVATGQTINIATPGSSLSFLGSATNGPSSGTATITYSDTSTQTVTLAFSDWTLNAGNATPIAGNTIAATTAYRNTATGSKETVNTYVFATSVSLTAGKTVASVTLPATVNQGHLHVFALATSGAQTGAQSDWTQYTHDLAASNYNSAEATLNAGNFANLTRKWQVHTNGGMSDQAIESNNVVYWGSWDGYLHAYTTDGADKWDTQLGVTTDNSCNPVSVGVASTPVLGSINGTPTIYVGGGGNDAVGGNNVYLYAINANTGAITWKTTVGSAPNDFAWSSPVVYNGSVYYGLASFGDCPLTQGRMLRIDASSGTIQNTFYTVPNGCTAGGIWGSPSIDTATGKLYVPTGTPSGDCAGQPGDYSMSLLELNASDLSYVASWRIPANQTAPDGDFGSVPTLFYGTVGGAANTPLVGVANKNGIFYAFKRSDVGAGPVWQTKVADTGACPQCGSGSIAPAVWDGTTLYAAGGNITINGTACKGSVSALNPSTGAYIWQHCLNDGPVLSSLTAIPGVIVVTQGSWVVGMNTSGTSIFHYQEPGGGATYYSPVTIANGRMYAMNLNGDFVAFGL